MRDTDFDEGIMSGATWHKFCDQLKQTGDQIMRPETPTDPRTKAEGFRYLTRLLRLGLEMHVEFTDPEFPVFFSPCHETMKIGADNPDNFYQMCGLRGDCEYLIKGHRNTVNYLSFRTQKGGYETDGKMIECGFFDGKDLILDADGYFEITISCDHQEGNWLPLDADATAMIVRQTYHDRQTETCADITIERINANTKPQPLRAVEFAQGLMRAADFVTNTSNLFNDWAQSYQAHPNQLPPADQALCQSVGGDPNIIYYHSYWELSDQEAWVIDVDRIPDCDTWNFQINNYWLESLDYRYHRICINKHNAHYNHDGSVTLVLSHHDIGHPNWLTTAGHFKGTCLFRWVGLAAGEEQCNPTARKVNIAEIANLELGSKLVKEKS